MMAVLVQPLPLKRRRLQPSDPENRLVQIVQLVQPIAGSDIGDAFLAQQMDVAHPGGQPVLPKPLVGFQIDDPDVPLQQFGCRENERFSYVYDMGDHWEHEIRVEAMNPPPSNEPVVPQ